MVARRGWGPDNTPSQSRRIKRPPNKDADAQLDKPIELVLVINVKGAICGSG
jgi:hypothetical protein